MSMLACLLCQRQLRLFKISRVHKGTKHPIKNYIIEFLGQCESYLKDDYGMCCNCVYVLNNLLFIKRYMYLIIETGKYDFCSAYKQFMEKLEKIDYDLVNDDYDDEMNKNYDNKTESNRSDNDSTDSEIDLRSQRSGSLQRERRSISIGTPSSDKNSSYKEFPVQLQKVNLGYEDNDYYDDETTRIEEYGDKSIHSDDESNESDTDLLRPQRTSPYDQEKEAKLHEGRSGTPWADIEVRRTFRRRSKRKRGHGWTKRKGSQSRARAATTLSEPLYRRIRSRARSRNYSDYHKSEIGSDIDSYDDTSSVATRSTFKHLSDYDTTAAEITGRNCIEGCTSKFSKLADLTEHKIKVHGMLAKYMCNECYRQRFVSAEDLKIHNNLCHNALITHCLLCNKQLRSTNDLKLHLQKHYYSCSNCERSFLTPENLLKHTMNSHKAKRKKSSVCQNKMVFSIKKIDNSTSSNNVITNNNKYEPQIVRLLQKTPSINIYSSSYSDIIENSFMDKPNGSYKTNYIQHINENLKEKCKSQELINETARPDTHNKVDLLEISDYVNEVCNQNNENDSENLEMIQLNHEEIIEDIQSEPHDDETIEISPPEVINFNNEMLTVNQSPIRTQVRNVRSTSFDSFEKFLQHNNSKTTIDRNLNL